VRVRSSTASPHAFSASRGPPPLTTTMVTGLRSFPVPARRAAHDVPSWTYTLEDYAVALADAGFVIEVIREPTPDSDTRFQRWAKVPLFMNVRPSGAELDNDRSVSTERWRTDDDLLDARERFARGIPGYVSPAAYSLARRDGEQLTFGHVNDLGGLHRLPAVILASVCGYVDTTGTFPMSQPEVRQAAELLAPAEAAAHHEHPNLWSWRTLLEASTPASRFVAFFLRGPDDPTVDADDELFRTMLHPAESS
jgi:hypothetical protein